MSENVRFNTAPVAAHPFTVGPTLGRWALPATSAWVPAALASAEILFRAGSLADRIYTVTAGMVKLVAHLPNGRVRILGLHGPGAVLGQVIPEAFRTSHHHTAVAVTDVEAAWLPTAELRRIRRDCAEEYLRLIERRCEEQKSAERWITEFSADTTPCRIARLIRYLSELQRLSQPDAVELLTCQEMAEVVGVSTESASRVLARFKRSKILTPIAVDATSRLYRFDAAALDEIACA